MTKQLQKILEKLSDKGLNDETREKCATCHVVRNTEGADLMGQTKPPKADLHRRAQISADLTSDSV